jgi:hypothetical protein
MTFCAKTLRKTAKLCCVDRSLTAAQPGTLVAVMTAHASTMRGRAIGNDGSAGRRIVEGTSR